MPTIPELEISATRMDLQCTQHRLTLVMDWMRRLARVPAEASFWYAYTALTRRADQGDRYAARKISEFHHAATAYEGARVALAELTSTTNPPASPHDDPEPDDTLCITGDEARALREAMTAYANQT